MTALKNELKPSLEEALEHYGVKGMKWGVRRDQATLDRAAGRRSIKKARRSQDKEDRQKTKMKNLYPDASLARRVAGHKTVNPAARSADIKQSRALVKKMRSDLKETSKKAKQSKDPQEIAKLTKQYVEQRGEIKRSHEVARAMQMTLGEVVAVSVITTPLGGAIAYSNAKAASDRVRAQRDALITSDFKQTPYKDIVKASQTYIEKESKK